jgi:hypothetical protein
MRVTDGLAGEGTISIGKGGKLILDDMDKTVDISFDAAGKGAKLDLSKSDLLHATIKGFADGNSIHIGGLDEHATIRVAAKGANTVVSIIDHGKEAGSLTFAGHYAKGGMHLSASGLLTTTGREQSADAEEGGAGGTSGADHLHDKAASDALDGGASHDGFVFDVRHGADVDAVPGFTADAGHAQIVYDQGSGNLLYDADGRGEGHAVHLATLAAHLLAADFMVM